MTASITLRNARLTFRTTKSGPIGLREWCHSKFGWPSARKVYTIHSLNDVSLDIHSGDRIGLIGNNGAGKSTLLRVLGGIYELDEGQCEVDGSVSTLFNIMLGFEAFSTGWENIRYRAYLQGESKASVDAKIDEIGAFTELGDFLDIPVSGYSAGMRARLGFSVVTAMDPDILLVDEAINAGDALFREKARQRICEIMSAASVVVLATHDEEFMQQICNRVIWLENGRIRADGCPAEVIRGYQMENVHKLVALQSEMAKTAEKAKAA